MKALSSGTLTFYQRRDKYIYMQMLSYCVESSNRICPFIPRGALQGETGHFTSGYLHF